MWSLWQTGQPVGSYTDAIAFFACVGIDFPCDVVVYGDTDGKRYKYNCVDCNLPTPPNPETVTFDDNGISPCWTDLNLNDLSGLLTSGEQLADLLCNSAVGLQALRECLEIGVRNTVVRLGNESSDSRIQESVFTTNYVRQLPNSCVVVMINLAHTFDIQNTSASNDPDDMKGEAKVFVRFNGGGESTVVNNRVNTLAAPLVAGGDTFRSSTAGSFIIEICGTADIEVDIIMQITRGGTGVAPIDESLHQPGSGNISHGIIAPSQILFIETSNG